MLETEGVIEKFVPVDFTDAETVFERTLEVWGMVKFSSVESVKLLKV